MKATDLSFVLLPEILEPKGKCMSSQIKGLHWVDSSGKCHIQRGLHSVPNSTSLTPIGRSTVCRCPHNTYYLKLPFVFLFASSTAVCISFEQGSSLGSTGS